MVERGARLSVNRLDCRRIGTAVVYSGFMSQAYWRDGNQDHRYISTIVVSFVDRGRIGAIIWLVDRRCTGAIVQLAIGVVQSLSSNGL